MQNHRLSYEQYGSKLAFTFRHAHSEIFLFCFSFSLFKAKSQRFCGLHKNTQTLQLNQKPVLFIGFVVLSTFYLLFGCGIALDKSNGISFFRNTPLFLKCRAISYVFSLKSFISLFNS